MQGSCRLSLLTTYSRVDAAGPLDRAPPEPLFFFGAVSTLALRLREERRPEQLRPTGREMPCLPALLLFDACIFVPRDRPMQAS
jgi:hypothetical protein